MPQITDLRDELFATLRALRDESNPMDLARAREVANVAGVIIDSAKVEVEFMKVSASAVGTGFIPVLPDGAVPDGPPPRARELGAAATRRLSSGAVTEPEPTPIRKCGACGQTTRQNPCKKCGAPMTAKTK